MKISYLTGKDLGLKPSTIEQARLEYSPLVKIFNKGIDKDDQKEGLFKRLKNIEFIIKTNNSISKTTTNMVLIFYYKATFIAFDFF